MHHIIRLVHSQLYSLHSCFFLGFFLLDCNVEISAYLSSIYVYASLHLKQLISSVSLFKVNDNFFLVRLTRHFFLCSSPFPWKIYERCPGGHEFLPHQVLCERITTMSVPQRQLVQDRMHWSFKVGRKAAQRKMGWVGGIVMKWKEEKISLHSGPHAGAARAIMWMEMISFPGFNAEVGASVFSQLNHSESVSLAPFCLLPPLIYPGK